MITDYIHKSYRTLRAQGIPARTAHEIATIAQDVRTFEAEHVTYLSSGPARVDLGDGWTYEVDAEHDGDAQPDDNGVFEEDVLAAWDNDEWRYVTVKVTATSPDGKVSESTYLGGVEVGAYWQATTLLDDEQEVIRTARDYDLFAEARGFAEAVPTCGACGHPQA